MFCHSSRLKNKNGQPTMSESSQKKVRNYEFVVSDVFSGQRKTDKYRILLTETEAAEFKTLSLIIWIIMSYQDGSEVKRVWVPILTTWVQTPELTKIKEQFWLEQFPSDLCMCTVVCACHPTNNEI